DETLLAEYKKTCDEAIDKEMTATLETDLSAYRTERDKILALDFTKPNASEQANQMQKDTKTAYRQVLDDLQKIQDYNTKSAKDGWNDTTVMYDNATKIVIGVILVMSILSILVGILIIKSITSPIELLNKLLSNIANRDLTTDAPTNYGAEFGQMFRAFNHMNENLRGIIGNVVASSNTVKDATENVVDKNEQTQMAMGDIITMVSDLTNEMTQK